MSALDWAIVVLLNGSIIGFGLWLSRGVQSSADWFLAGRALPWWLVGISMYATAIDSSDLVADSGYTYNVGFSYFVANWVGITGGWALAAYFIFLPMYRVGMYTNAEYLEARFGASARVICALIQVQYRTLVVGIMSETVFLTLSIVGGWDPTSAWIAVVVIAVVASVYTALGGLKSVAITDSMQFVVMTIAAIIIWFVIYGQVGGWSGIKEKLSKQESETNLADSMLHIGHDNVSGSAAIDPNDSEAIGREELSGGQYDPKAKKVVRRTSWWAVSIAFVILGIGYSIVNHTQSMRMFGSKNEWNLKMCVFAAGMAMIIMTFFNLTMGIMGRALVPDVSTLPFERGDSIYPFLVREYTWIGLRGLVVAGILAASFSTYDSIGSSLSALLTRDIYARFIKRDQSDRHYLVVGQWLVPLIIGISFCYVPFLKSGMLSFYLELTSAFVTPLLTLFFMGTLTKVHRKSALIGLIVGAGYGMLRLWSPVVAKAYGFALVPTFMANSFTAYPIAMALTAGTMVLLSLIWGFEKVDLKGREKGAWLQSSQEQVQQLEEKEQAQPMWLPAVLAIFVVTLGMILSYVVFF